VISEDKEVVIARDRGETSFARLTAIIRLKYTWPYISATIHVTGSFQLKCDLPRLLDSVEIVKSRPNSLCLVLIETETEQEVVWWNKCCKMSFVKWQSPCYVASIKTVWNCRAVCDFVMFVVSQLLQIEINGRIE